MVGAACAGTASVSPNRTAVAALPNKRFDFSMWIPFLNVQPRFRSATRSVAGWAYRTGMVSRFNSLLASLRQSGIDEAQGDAPLELHDAKRKSPKLHSDRFARVAPLP